MSLSVSRLALGDVDHELTLTRTLLDRVPGAQLAWRPHEKSWTLGSLAAHIANLPMYGTSILETEEFDLGAPMPRQGEPASRDEILALFERQSGGLRGAMSAATDEALLQKWTLRKGAHVITQVPRAAALRSMFVSHMVHHRGQLSVYYRMVGVPVPGLYGPSADER